MLQIAIKVPCSGLDTSMLRLTSDIGVVLPFSVGKIDTGIFDQLVRSEAAVKRFACHDLISLGNCFD
jgi:hypothetical protein